MTNGSYEHGYDFGQRNANIYGEHHGARFDYPHDTEFCRGYRDGYASVFARTVATPRKSSSTRRLRIGAALIG